MARPPEAPLLQSRATANCGAHRLQRGPASFNVFTGRSLRRRPHLPRAAPTAPTAPTAKRRSDRAQLEHELGAQREAREAAGIQRGETQTALEAAHSLRAQLEAELATTNRRLEAAEKARDAAIATRGTTRRATRRRKR